MSGRPVTSRFTVNRQRSPSPPVRDSECGKAQSRPLSDTIWSPRRGGHAMPQMNSPAADWCDEPVVEEEVGEKVQSHKPTCPRSKSRTRDISRHSSHDQPTVDGTVLHPKPWGARDPSDIKCFCFNLPRTAELLRNRSRSPDQIRATPSDTEVKRMLRTKCTSKPRCASLGPAAMKAQENKRKKMINNYCEEFCEKMLSQFGKLTVQDETFALERIKRILSKNGSEVKRKKQVESPAPMSARRSFMNKKEQAGPVVMQRKSRSPEPLSVVPAVNVNAPDTLPMDKPAVTGKVEKNQYMIEVSTNAPGANFRDIIGTLNNTLMSDSPTHGDSQLSPKFSIVNKTVYGDVPDNYDRMNLMGIDNNVIGSAAKKPTAMYSGKRDVRSLQAKDIRVRQDINEQNYTFYLEENKQKFTKRLSNTQAEMFINPQSKGLTMGGKNHPEMPSVTKIYYVQNETSPAKPRSLPSSKRM